MILKQLRIFLAVIDAGSVRQAAVKLNLSQSSVTKSIQQLEHELHAQLLTRSVHGVAPTPAGTLLAARAKLVDAELRHARNEIAEFNDAASGDIRVCASPAVCMGLLPRAIVNFTRARPGARFQIQEGIYPHILKPLRGGDVDLAIALVPEKPNEEDIRATILLRDSVTPAVRVNHPMTQCRQVALADLLDLEWVVYKSSKTGREIFDHCFASNGLATPARIIECASFACTLAMIEMGNYATLLPTQIFANPTHKMGISPLYMQTPMPRWDVALLARAGLDLSPVCLAFIDELHLTAKQIHLSVA